MAQSMSPECTPLKHAYDSCFNAWFEGYLQPAVSAFSKSEQGGRGGHGKDAAEQRAAYAKAKADEFEEKCGGLWKEYKACVQKAVKDKGLDAMLTEATKENPLDKPPTPASNPSS